MEFEEIARGLYLEGLCPDGERVWISDPVRGGIQRVAADGTTEIFLPDRLWIGSLMRNSDGLLIVAGEGGFIWLDGSTGKTGTVLDSIEGQPIGGVNETCADAEGGIYFGTIDIPAIARAEQPGPSRLYRLAPDGIVTDLDVEIKFANGLGLSLDGRNLFVNETFGGVWMFDVNPGGTVANGRMILDKPDSDGMALDEQGNVWVTGYKSGVLTCLNPDGSFQREVEHPGGGCTSMRFGGADRRTLYVNTVPADAGDRLAVGDMPASDESICYRARSEVAGIAGRSAAIRIAR